MQMSTAHSKTTLKATVMTLWASDFLHACYLATCQSCHMTSPVGKREVVHLKLNTTPWY